MITATPCFDGNGDIEYVVVEAIRIDELQKKYQECINNKISYESSSVLLEKKDDNSKSFLTNSDKMKELLKQIEYVAKTDVSVLIEGETGVGKGVMANYIHENSNRKNAKLIEVNCAALPENLLESELYGYVKGSFTGALTQGKKGLIEEAENGTIFLDEINSMPIALQGKLLRVLETHKVKRIGALEEKYVDFRLIAATNQDLKKCVENGSFREDLYYRLKVVPVIIPPLRKRKEDIVVLANFFLKHYCNMYGCTKVFSKLAIEQLLKYEWPGNVRELQNTVERLCVVSSPSTIEINQIPLVFFSGIGDYENHESIDTGSNFDAINYFEVSRGNVISWDGFSLDEYLKEKEKAIIEKALQEGKSTYKTAKLLGINQSTVFRKKKQYGL